MFTSDGPAATRQLGNGSKRDASRRTLNLLAKGERRYSHTLIDAEVQETGGAFLVPETPTSHLRLVDHPRRVKLEDTEVI